MSDIKETIAYFEQQLSYMTATWKTLRAAGARHST